MKKEKINISEDGLAKMLNAGFQATQDLLIGEIRDLREEVKDGTKKTNQNFKIIKEKINNISLNIVDVVHREEFNRLESRVVDLEEAIDLPGKNK